MFRRPFAFLLLLALAVVPARADEAFRIGVLNDQSGPYADLSGPGGAESARMAVEDFGGSVLGKPIELLVADHQNKVDVGLAIARQWYDERRVRAIFDITNSGVGLAVQDLVKARDRIVIFDQGFLTALCSMALLAGSVDRSFLLRGLALIPRPNLLIRLDAPREILESRLHSRLGRQGPVERWFEFDLQTSLQQIELTNEVAQMLREKGGRMMHVSSLDRRMLENEVDRIVRGVKSWDEKIDLATRTLVERRPMVRVAR